tara:strand:+ start:155 stop:1042 length:888 start_codon:yes stop_codon:yes gene_type:complete
MSENNLSHAAINLKRINNEKVAPLILKGDKEKDNRPIKGASIFPELYANIFLCAKKKSGKTIAATKIIKDCASKQTKVIVFCSTLDKDENHLKIKKYCKLHKIPYEGYNSMFCENGNQKMNILQELMNGLEADAHVDSDEDEEEKEKMDRCQKKLMTVFNSDSDDDDDDDKRRKRNKFQSPEYIFFFDDLSNELKSPTLVSFLKKNRHYKCKVIVSSQYIHDLLPASLKQMDYCLTFKGMPEAKLQKIHSDFDLALDIESLINLYDYSTKEKYSFLYMDIREEKYRRNFDFQFEV